ncbi:piggyBac transposable element-derived protein 4 [Nephila pilipes]|uniref:PiggyBac transposable element-derived protein 4 n=1 Tax=Nephila pilipes TaxID=299642 RepID=A0A8X6UJV9_NEPPI|nr:piggyBac transposable element-derived protein 4 [Nephila pilipes]
MGLVDHLKSLYEIDRKSRKWGHQFFFHFLDSAKLFGSVFTIYKMLPNSYKYLKKLKNFILEFTRCLLMGNEDGQPKKLFSKGPSPVLIKKHKPNVPDEKRLQDVKLLPLKCKPRRCAFSNTTQ